MSGFHGYTEYELQQRRRIREQIERRNYTEARRLSLIFLKGKDRNRKRASLLRTIPYWVTAMNEGKSRRE